MFKGIISVLLAAIFWGTGGVCGQYLFTHSHIDAVWMVMVRQIVAGSLFLCYSKFILKDKLLELWREYPLQTLVFSFPGILGAQLGFYYTISLCNAATATILQYTAPIMVVLWMSFKKKAWPESRVVLGTILAFTGVFLISTHGSLDSLAISPLALCTGIFSAFSYALYCVQPVELLQRFPTTTVIGWGQLTSGLALIAFRNPLQLAGSWDISAVIALTYLILGATVLTYALYLYGLKIIGPTKAALFSCAEPLSSIVCVVVLMGTKLTNMDLAGMGCILFTVAMLSLPKK